MSSYDVIVIGAPARRLCLCDPLRPTGMKVACVEGRETLGGDLPECGLHPVKSDAARDTYAA